MIRQCTEGDFDQILEIVNDAAQAYKGVIPADRWKEPYMSGKELAQEIEDAILFWCFEEDGEMIGIMGIQHVQDVTLIRHAYVRTAQRGKGIGSKLLLYLSGITDRPIMIGTWTDAVWAIGFYDKHGFKMVDLEEKNSLLRKYWSVPERQIETSIVLADKKWFDSEKGAV